MDPTHRLAAASIVAAMVTAGHPLVRTGGGLTDWASIGRGGSIAPRQSPRSVRGVSLRLAAYKLDASRTRSK
jgi:hypothetical protein